MRFKVSENKQRRRNVKFCFASDLSILKVSDVFTDCDLIKLAMDAPDWQVK